MKKKCIMNLIYILAAFILCSSHADANRQLGYDVDFRDSRSPCLVDELWGGSYFVTYSDPLAPYICFKLDLFQNGSFAVDYNNVDCNNDSFGKFNILGTNQNHSENKVSFTRPGFTSHVQIYEDRTMKGSNMHIINYNQTFNDLLLNLIIPSCTAPSVAPSMTPSILPTDSPSNTISEIPSASPSATPTMAPTCSIKNLMGMSYFVPYDHSFLRFCIKIELFEENGKVYVDHTNPNCSNDYFTESIILNISSAFIGNKAEIQEVSSGWTGHISIEVDSLVQDIHFEMLRNPSSREFDMQLFYPSCFAPSMVPSSRLSNLPTFRESQMPSSNVRPTSDPTSLPSSFPTNTRTCSIDKFKNETIFVPYKSKCIKIEFFPEGVLSVDEKNKDCTQDFNDPIIYSVYDNSHYFESVIRFKAGTYYGWTGNVSVVEKDEKNQDLGVKSLDYNHTSKTFDLMLKIGSSCDPLSTNIPSLNPTVVHSVSPSFIPTSFPNSIPSSMPSAEPTIKSSVAPSVSDSSAPTNAPSLNPSIVPSVSPSFISTSYPNSIPSSMPSAEPTIKSSVAPSVGDSFSPTNAPSLNPSIAPSVLPSFQSSASPNTSATSYPTTSAKSNTPSSIPSENPFYWEQVGNSIIGETKQNRLGSSVSMSENGMRIAIGAVYGVDDYNKVGHVRIFQFDQTNDTWNQMGNDLFDEISNFGPSTSVSISPDGMVVAIGSMYSYGNSTTMKKIKSGRVRVFHFNGTDWNTMGDGIDGNSRNGLFGASVSLSQDGMRVVIGSRGDSFESKSHARVYEFNEENKNWGQLGGNIFAKNATESDVYFGETVSMSHDGSIVAIGGPGQNAKTGHVRIFQYNQNTSTWIQMGDDINGIQTRESFGNSVSISQDGKTVAIGADKNGINPRYSGCVRIFQYIEESDTWNQLGDDINGRDRSDRFGSSVSISQDGKTVVSEAAGAGYAQIFQYNGDIKSWKELGHRIDGRNLPTDGHSVSIAQNGTKVVIGTPQSDTATKPGRVEVYHVPSK